MGFTAVGKNPVNESGVRFKATLWAWEPLWIYVARVCEDILPEGASKTGRRKECSLVIDADTAKRMAFRLGFQLNQGWTANFARTRKERLDAMPDETCSACGGSGVRDDSIIKGVCNGCGGRGKVRPMRCEYSFSAEAVKQFAEFCRKSGGFEIC